MHALESREKRRSISLGTKCDSHVNWRYLSTPEVNTRRQNLRNEKRNLQVKIARLTAKLNEVIQAQGVELDADISSDFQKIMLEEDHAISKNFKPDTFQSIFWQQQKQSASTNSKGMRWHPLMIKWCLYLRHQSSKAYEVLRDSGVISLPSQRTLRDYSNCVKAKEGFSHEVDNLLMKSADITSCPEWHKLVILLLDEMYIKEDLVYNKHTGKMIGFVDLGEINNHLLEFEKSLEDGNAANSQGGLATSMLVIMVKGLFTPLRFAFAQFPCSSITGDLLFEPFWEAVFRLERMDFKVTFLLTLLMLLFFRFWVVLLMVHQLIAALSPFMTDLIN